jgi:methylphosphotriester-DNA--protein-cysteine methyltransferase
MMANKLVAVTSVWCRTSCRKRVELVEDVDLDQNDTHTINNSELTEEL